MTHMPQPQGFAAGGFDRRVRTDRRHGDRRRLSIAVPVDRRAQDRRSNRGRRITEWFGSGSENRPVSGRRGGGPQRRTDVKTIPSPQPKPEIEVLQSRTRPDSPKTCTPGETEPKYEVQPTDTQESVTLAPSFKALTFRHGGKPYTVEAVEEPTAGMGGSTWHWRVMANGVVEHTLRAMPHEDRNSLETRAIRTIEETAAGAVRELEFEYEGKRYHLEDRSDKLRRDSMGDTGMWCVTCDGVMEGSFQAKGGETEAVLRARAIQIARRSGEYQATLRSNYRPTRGKVLRQHLETAREVRSAPPSEQPAAQVDSMPTATPPTPSARVTPPDAVRPQISEAARPSYPARSGGMPSFNGRTPISNPGPVVNVQSAPRVPRTTEPRLTEPPEGYPRHPVRRGSPEFFTQPRPAPLSHANGKRPSPISGRISGPAVAVANPEPTPLVNAQRRVSTAGRVLGKSAITIVTGSVALASAVALMPFYAFRRGSRPRHRLRVVRSAQAWADAMPVRMLFPYVAAAALVLGLIPINATIWATGGMAAILLFPIRVKARSERFEVTQHVFDKTRTVSPSVEVHSTRQGLDDPRRVTRRRRSTASHRLLRSAGR